MNIEIQSQSALAGQPSRWRRAVLGATRSAAVVAVSLIAVAAQAQNFLVNKKFVDVQGVPNNQVNVLGPNQSTFLEFNLFNSSTGTLTASVTDALPAGLQGDTTFSAVMTNYAGVVNGSGCSIAPGSVSVTASTVTITNVTVPLVTAAGLNPDCRIVVKVKGDPAGIGNTQSNVTNSVPAAATSATGPGGPYQSDPFNATVLVQPVINSGLSKGFNPGTVPVNGLSTMTFTITNNAAYSIHNVALTDAVPANVVPQTGTASSSCGGTAAISGQNVSLSGATISGNSSCTVSVQVKGTLGGTVYLYMIVPKGFFPQEDIGQLSIQTEARQDISFPAMQALQAQAEAILRDAWERGRGIGIFEVTERSLAGLAQTMMGPLSTLMLTPFVRPYRFSRLVFTYAVPIVPALFLFDGLVSNLRTYTQDELRAMTRSLQRDDYRWEIGQVKHWLLPTKVTYLIGVPLRPRGA